MVAGAGVWLAQAAAFSFSVRGAMRAAALRCGTGRGRVRTDSPPGPVERSAMSKHPAACAVAGAPDPGAGASSTR